MDPLRTVLAVLGLLIVAAVYLWGRFKGRDRAGPGEGFEAHGAAPSDETGFSAERDPLVSSAELDELAGLHPDEGVPVVDDVPTPRAAPSHKEAAAREATLVIALTVIAPPSQPFTGPALLEAMESVQMRLGEMSIFHRHDPDGENGALFSAANILEPGTFDRDKMADFSTPGVVLFLSLPTSRSGLEVFDEMLSVGRTLTERLGGELCDEARSTLSGQTIAHLRDRIHEFEHLPAHG